MKRGEKESRSIVGAEVKTGTKTRSRQAHLPGPPACLTVLLGRGKDTVKKWGRNSHAIFTFLKARIRRKNTSKTYQGLRRVLTSNTR